jgi:hypothetical protein
MDTARRFGGAFCVVGMVADHLGAVAFLGVVAFAGTLLKSFSEVLHTNHHLKNVMICMSAFDKNTHKS